MGRHFLMTPIAAAILVCAFAPMAWLFVPLLSPDLPARLAPFSARHGELLVTTLAVSTLTAMLAALWGTLVGVTLIGSSRSTRTLLTGASFLPLALPPFVQAVAWIEIGNAGGSPPFTAHGRLATLGLSPALLGIVESAWVLSLCLYPVVSCTVAATMGNRLRTWEEEARLHGSDLTIARYLLVPQMAPSVLLGALVVFFCRPLSSACPTCFSAEPIRGLSSLSSG